ncbi:MAG: hypothetical protein ACM3XM_12800 [Mycobacterium leprae]
MFDWRDLLALFGVLLITSLFLIMLYAPVRSLSAGPTARPLTFRQFLRAYPGQVTGLTLLSLCATTGAWLALRSHHTGRLWLAGLLLLIAGPVIGIPLIILGSVKK